MNFKRTILYLLFSIIILILVYNYALPYMAPQYTSEMGMHMANSYNNSVFYGNLIGIFIFMLIILIVILTLFKVFSSSGQKKCKNCGLVIESNEWKICPRCGNPLKDGSVN